MIQKLKDELTIEQLQLIKSICDGKLQDLQGSQTERPKSNEQLEVPVDKNSKPNVEEDLCLDHPENFIEQNETRGPFRTTLES